MKGHKEKNWGRFCQKSPLPINEASLLGSGLRSLSPRYMSEFWTQDKSHPAPDYCNLSKWAGVSFSATYHIFPRSRSVSHCLTLLGLSSGLGWITFPTFSKVISRPPHDTLGRTEAFVTPPDPLVTFCVSFTFIGADGSRCSTAKARSATATATPRPTYFHTHIHTSHDFYDQLW